jgi:hypothetical protein
VSTHSSGRTLAKAPGVVSPAQPKRILLIISRSYCEHNRRTLRAAYARARVSASASRMHRNVSLKISRSDIAA